MRFVETLEAKKLAVIGDVHGMLDKLESLVSVLRRDYPDHTIVCAGDLCDRGPDSPGVLDFVIENDIPSVLGNHDQWFMDVLDPDISETDKYRVVSSWTYGSNGGIQTLLSLGFEGELTFRDIINTLQDPKYRKYFDYFSKMPLVYDTPYGYVLHGGIPARFKTEFGLSDGSFIEDYFDQGVSVDDCIWGRMDWCPEGWALLDKPQIVGHSYPRDGQELIWSDSVVTTDSACGCREGAPLTAALFPENKFVQV